MNRREFVQRITAVLPLSFLSLARRKQPRFVVKFDGKPMFNDKLVKVDAVYSVRGRPIDMSGYRKLMILTPDGWKDITK